MGTFDSLPLRDQTKKHILKWLRVQDQKRPRRVAPTCLLSSLRGKFRSSKRPSVSWMLIRMASCPPQTSSRPSTPLVNPFPTVKPKACLAKPQAQSIYADVDVDVDVDVVVVVVVVVV